MLHVKVLSSFYVSQLDVTLLSLQGPEGLSIYDGKDILREDGERYRNLGFVLVDPAIYSIQHNIANLKIADNFPKCEDAYLVDKIDSEKDH
jgi:hypothetical protein